MSEFLKELHDVGGVRPHDVYAGMDYGRCHRTDKQGCFEWQVLHGQPAREQECNEHALLVRCQWWRRSVVGQDVGRTQRGWYGYREARCGGGIVYPACMASIDVTPAKASRYLRLARAVADIFSKDSTKVGCVIVAPGSYQILSCGYNGFCRGIDETIAERRKRPEKYVYTCHAEINAITNAARHGTPLLHGIAFVTLFPCVECAKALIQAGCSALVCEAAPDLADATWGASWNMASEIMEEAGLEVVYVQSTTVTTAESV